MNDEQRGQATTTAGAASLSYAAATGTYNYIWRVDASWAGTARTFIMVPDDGTSHQAISGLSGDYGGKQMSRTSAPARHHGLLGTVLWAALMVGSIVLIAIGLRIALFFGYMPEPSQVRDLRTGNLYILAGSLANLAAATWSALRGHPYWVTACVAAPAVLVGGSALVAPTTLLRHLAAAVAFPFALGAVFWGLRYREHGDR